VGSRRSRDEEVGLHNAMIGRVLFKLKQTLHVQSNSNEIRDTPYRLLLLTTKWLV
jgi:hypothetical protein